MRIERLATSFQGRVDAGQKCTAAPGKRENRSTERRLLSAGCQRPNLAGVACRPELRRGVSTALSSRRAWDRSRNREVERDGKSPPQFRLNQESPVRLEPDR